MGTLVNNKVSEVILSNVESAVEFGSVDTGQTVQEDMEIDPENNTVIHTSITFESINNNESSGDEPTVVRRVFKSNLEDSDGECTTRLKGLVDSDSSEGEEEIVTKKSAGPKKGLFDSDHSDEEHEDNESNKAQSEDANENIIPKLTPRQAKEQRQEIRSESQRRTRESRISLPYHKPKHRTLKEFLQCRPKISEPLPDDIRNKSTINAIKLASYRQEEITKKLAEREKIVEKFYQSSSDSETENVPDQVKEAVKEIIPEPPEEIALFSIQSILDEMNLDFTSIKDELVKSFSKPSRVPDKLDFDTRFEDQDDPELISQSDFNKIIDTLNTETEDPLSQTPSQKLLPKLSGLEATALVEKYNQATESWRKDKSFEKLSDTEEEVPKKTIIKKTGFIPKLSGGPNQIIDLDEGIPEPNKGVKDLVQRFIQHTSRKSTTPSKVVEVSIVTADSGELIEEKLRVSRHNVEEESPMNERPGAKLLRLREDLQKQIALRRAENWAKKQKETKELLGITDDNEDEEMFIGEKEECCEDEEEQEEGNDGNGNANLEEDGDDDTEIIEIEEEGKFTDIEEKLVPKSAYIEEEADESEIEDGSEAEDEASDEDDEHSEIEVQVVKKKVLRRIKEVSGDDSSDDENEMASKDLITPKKLNESDQEEISLCQRRSEKTPTHAIINGHLSETPNTFLSPVLTAFQSMSAVKATQVSPQFVLEEPSPLKGESHPPKKLFTEPEITNTQDNINELLNLCSGKFDTTTQKLSQEPELALTPASQWMNSDSDTEIKNAMKTKTLEPPTPEPTKKGLRIVLSSDSEGEAPKKQKYITKLTFSDDEDAVSDIEEERVVEYDSEENEIDPKAQGFFDVEAELSEDDYQGSDDEAEHDLDEMEQEDGDADKINESKVRRDLEKIHMRQVLDQDKREVRILQELYLEDGDLHSDKGRQRQFKWKNTPGDFDNDENRNPVNDNDSDVYDVEDDEQEEKWRQMRHERETFLREQRMKNGDTSIDIIDLDEPPLKLGQSTLRKSIIGVTPPFRKSLGATAQSGKKIIDEDPLKKPLGLLNKKGSFLSRGQECLARLAARTKDEPMLIGGVKNSRNFVFQTLEKPEPDSVSVVPKPKTQTVNLAKRKATDLNTTPLMLKKLRVAEALDKKVSSRVKRLFENL